MPARVVAIARPAERAAVAQRRVTRQHGRAVVSGGVHAALVVEALVHDGRRRDDGVLREGKPPARRAVLLEAKHPVRAHDAARRALLAQRPSRRVGRRFEAPVRPRGARSARDVRVVRELALAARLARRRGGDNAVRIRPGHGVPDAACAGQLAHRVVRVPSAAVEARANRDGRIVHTLRPARARIARSARDVKELAAGARAGVVHADRRTGLEFPFAVKQTKLLGGASQTVSMIRVKCNGT